MFEGLIKILQMEISARVFTLGQFCVWTTHGSKKSRETHLPAWLASKKVKQIKLMKALGNQIISVDYS